MERLQKIYFTDEKLNEYLVNKLDFSNWKIIQHRDRLEFLTYLQQKYTTRIYYQNIRMCSLPPASRAVPTVEEVIANGFAGRGGVCYELNYFFHLLLISLGFDSFVIRANFPGFVNDCHLISIVRLRPDQQQQQEELYLVDVGTPHPLDAPVPLHQLPQKRQTGGFHYEFCEYVSETCETITHARYQIGGSVLQDQALDDPKHQTMRFEFDLIPRTLDYFDSVMRTIFTDADSNRLMLQRPLLFRYLKHEFTEPDDAQWILILGLKILVANKKERKITRYHNYAEVMEAIEKYFPGMDKDEMRRAFELFQKVLEQENGLEEPVL